MSANQPEFNRQKFVDLVWVALISNLISTTTTYYSRIYRTQSSWESDDEKRGIRAHYKTWNNPPDHISRHALVLEISKARIHNLLVLDDYPGRVILR